MLEFFPIKNNLVTIGLIFYYHLYMLLYHQTLLTLFFVEL